MRLPPEQALLRALGHPLRALLLRLCLEAEEPKSPKGLALETHRGKGSFQVHLSNVSYHVRTLADYGALEIAEERPRRGSVAHFYRPTELVRKTPWVLAALGLAPPSGKDRSIEKELRARIAEHVAERRRDPEFMELLHRLMGGR
jgi:DNA-binding transcriptional ArsR family regulator